ncbi:MAG: ATP-binding protein [Chloroflexi bacterium]|nr:ATP-binding protein [Chloroflexota bacterium]
MRRSAPVDVELSQRIYWLIQLRWLASSAVIYGTFLSTTLFGVRLDPLPLYLIGAAIAMYNTFFIVGLKWNDVVSGDSQLAQARMMANAQIVTDLLFLTLLIHFSGGVENPLAFYFIFHVIIASILLSRRATFIQATVAIVLFGSLVLGEYARIIPHVSLFGRAGLSRAHDGLFVATVLLVFSSTLYLAAYMATSIMGRMRARGMEILGLTMELERKAQELERAYNQLSELEQMKSQHMRRVSQEMRAPLAAVQNSLRGALEGRAGELPAAQRDMIARAERRTHSLLTLVGDLLVLSRARETRLFTDRQPVSPLTVVEKVVAQQAPKAVAKVVALSTRAPDAAPTMFADPEALEQLLSNLLSNALNYTPAGGKVDLAVDVLEDNIRFRVSDTGIGIPSAEIPKVFNEFYRAENARRFSEEGTGLGLSIVRSIVDTHGGQIDLESQVGVGTTVTVVLPCGENPAAEGEAEGEEQPLESRASPSP